MTSCSVASHVQLFVTPWTAVHQASLSFTVSQSLLNSFTLHQWCCITISSSTAPSFLALNLSQHQGLFQGVGASWQVAKVLELQLQHQFFQWIYCCSVTESCPTLGDPMDCSTPGFPVIHYLPEFAQTHVHWVDETIQPSHPLSPSSPALSLFQHQGLFQWV